MESVLDYIRAVLLHWGWGADLVSDSKKRKEIRRRVLDHLVQGRNQGADVLLEPKTMQPAGFEHGYYVSPSVLTGDPENICCREEIFGPSAYILRFRDESDAVRQVNSVPYGLANSVWSADLSRANRVAEQMIAGNNWITCTTFSPTACHIAP